jgi:hypothetical protein
MPYPVTITVEPQLGNRNRLTVGFRLLLAIPHIFLVGGIGLSATRSSSGDSIGFGGEAGVFGAIAIVLAIIAWFTIVFAGKHFPGIRQFTAFYMRWRLRAVAYEMLLVDRYPPFGDSAYPVSMTLVDPTGPRKRLNVAVRLLLGIPHFFMLALLITAWWITSIVAWVLILATGDYPKGLYDFGVGVLRWYTRVAAYMLLMVDEYPPFSFS